MLYIFIAKSLFEALSHIRSPHATMLDAFLKLERRKVQININFSKHSLTF